MLYGSDRDDLRRVYVDAWSKSRAGHPLDPLERLLADVIAEHPEYHAVLESPDALTREFPPEADRSNPFLHMGLHIAIREQLATDRPPGCAGSIRSCCRGSRMRIGSSTPSWNASRRRCGTHNGQGPPRTKRGI